MITGLSASSQVWARPPGRVVPPPPVPAGLAGVAGIDGDGQRACRRAGRACSSCRRCRSSSVRTWAIDEASTQLTATVTPADPGFGRVLDTVGVEVEPHAVAEARVERGDGDLVLVVLGEHVVAGGRVGVPLVGGLDRGDVGDDARRCRPPCVPSADRWSTPARCPHSTRRWRRRTPRRRSTTVETYSSSGGKRSTRVTPVASSGPSLVTSIGVGDDVAVVDRGRCRRWPCRPTGRCGGSPRWRCRRRRRAPDHRRCHNTSTSRSRPPPLTDAALVWGFVTPVFAMPVAGSGAMSGDGGIESKVMTICSAGARAWAPAITPFQVRSWPEIEGSTAVGPP